MSSTSRLDAARYLEALKDLLRERGVRYAQLAEGLGCSLPTVKRAMNKPSLPFSRLLEMCEVAEIAFSELHERADQARPQHYVFTEEQDRLFAEREELLRYFVELAGGRVTPSEIAERHELDQQSTDLYLRHLIELGLIERDAHDGIVLRVRPPFGFGPRSRVLGKQHEEFLRTVVDQVLDGDPDESRCAAVLKPLCLTEDDYDEMVASLVNVIHRFAAISERGLGRGPTSQWQLALACGPGPEGTHIPLPRIDH